MSEATQSAPAPAPVVAQDAPASSAPVPAIAESAPAIAVDADLAAAVAAHRDRFKPKIEAAQPAQAEVSTAAQPPTMAAPAATESQKETAEDNTPAGRIGEYLRQTRAARAAAKAAAEKQAKLDAEIAALSPFREAAELKAKDPAAALRKLFGKELDETDLLVRALASPSDAPAELTEEEKQAKIIEKAAALAEEKRKAADAEAKAKAKEEADKRTAELQASYYAGVAAELDAKASKYPLLHSDGIDGKAWDALLHGHKAATGKVPTFDMLAAHFEKQLESTARTQYETLQKRFGGQQPAPKRSAPSALPVAVPAQVVGSGSPTAEKPAVRDYKADRAERLARLREADRQAMIQGARR